MEENEKIVPVVVTEQGGDLVERFIFRFWNNFVGKNPKESQQYTERQEYVILQCFLLEMR